MSPWLLAVSWHAETLVSTSLYVSVNIHVFFIASRALVFGIACRRATKIPSSLVGVFRGQRRGRMRRPSYFVCYLRVVL